MVTVEHVVAAMRLSDQDWKEIEIRKAEDKQLIPARSSPTQANLGGLSCPGRRGTIRSSRLFACKGVSVMVRSAAANLLRDVCRSEMVRQYVVRHQVRRLTLTLREQQILLLLVSNMTVWA